MSRERNSGMIGGAQSKDPNMAEYESKSVGQTGMDVAGSASAGDIPQPELKTESAGVPVPVLVKIPMDWPKKFSIVYDNGETVEYGRGKTAHPPAGAKPLYYLLEALA